MAPAPHVFSVRDVRLRRSQLGERIRSAAWGSFGAGSLLFGLGMLAAALRGPGAMPIPMAVAILAGALAVYAWPVVLALGLLIGRRQRVPGTRLRLEGADLVVEDDAGRVTTFAGPFRQGAALQDGVVVEDARGRQLSATLDPRSAAQLIDALDLEPEKRRFTFRWQNVQARVGSWLTGFFAFGLLGALPLVLAHGQQELIGIATSCSILLAPLFLTELTSRWWSRRELTVGLDGVEHQSRRGKKLLRFADVRSVRTEASELVVQLRDGTEHRLLADPSDAAERTAIEARIREAMAVARAKAGTHSVTGALLERAGRSLSEWRDAAARVLTAATGFRDAMIGADELGAVLEDATATAEQRMAAAIALGSLPEHRPRVRVAAETIASPKLRVALSTIAEGLPEEEVLASALEEDQAARR